LANTTVNHNQTVRHLVEKALHESGNQGQAAKLGIICHSNSDSNLIKSTLNVLVFQVQLSEFRKVIMRFGSRDTWCVRDHVESLFLTDQVMYSCTSFDTYNYVMNLLESASQFQGVNPIALPFYLAQGYI
jgi:hypothetical protein